MPIDPDNDPNEAYEVEPMKVEPHGPPAYWWRVTCNGIPVHHFTPERREIAEHYRSRSRLPAEPGHEVHSRMKEAAN